MSVISQSLIKLPLALASGAAVTLVLFSMMQALVRTDSFEGGRKDPIKLGPISIPQLLPTPVKEHKKPEKIEEVDRPIIDKSVQLTYDGQGIPSVIRPPVVTVAKTDLGEGLGIIDGNALAMVKVQPVYPRRALQRGITGYVVLEFTINELGMVEEPRVIVSEPPGVFDRAALKALERWKFQPKVVNGVAKKTHGVQQKMSFNLE